MSSISKTLLCTMRMCTAHVVEIRTDVNIPVSVYKNNAFTKDSYALGASQALAFTVSIEQHKAKRKTLNPCFSKSSINNMEEKLYEELDLVFAKIREYERKGEEVPIAELLYCYTVSPHTFKNAMSRGLTRAGRHHLHTVPRQESRSHLGSQLRRTIQRNANFHQGYLDGCPLFRPPLHSRCSTAVDVGFHQRYFC